MKNLQIMGVAFALAATTPAAAASESVSIDGNATFEKTLREMGYAPKSEVTESGATFFIADIGDVPTNLILGGCTDGRACRYLYMSSSYTDVPNPPENWVTNMNDTFDILKIGRNDAGNLYYSAAHVVEGIPRSVLKQIFNMWVADADALADEARKAGLVK